MKFEIGDHFIGEGEITLSGKIESIEFDIQLEELLK